MTNDLQRRVDCLAAGFYEAATRPESWRPALQALTELFGAEGAMFASVGESHLAPVNTASLDEAVAYGLEHGLLASNPRTLRGLAQIARTGDIVTESMLFSREELDRDPFNAELPNRFNLRWFVGGALVPAGAQSILFSIERRKNQEPFGAAELDLLRAILPHFQRAGLMATQWAQAMAQSALDAFEALGAGAILIGGGGRVLRMSRRAEAHQGVAFRLEGGQLRAMAQGADAALQRLVGSLVALAPPTQIMPLGPAALPRPVGRPLIVSGAPMGAQAMRRERAALVLTDPDEQLAPSNAALAAAFGLTPAERRVSRLFAQGRSPEEIAAALAIGVGTVRTHLKAIMAKTQTHRQSELAVVLARVFRA